MIDVFFLRKVFNCKMLAFLELDITYLWVEDFALQAFFPIADGMKMRSRRVGLDHYFMAGNTKLFLQE